MKSQAILVLGMHRSGTSALSGALHILRVPLGSTLIPADPEVNAKGYWEHSVITDINERILARFGSSWLDERALPENWWKDEALASLREELLKTLRQEFGSCPLWAVKDPRLCRLLPLWLEVLEEIECEPRIMIITRDPVETALSLKKRNGMHVWKSALLWLRYMLEAELYSRGRSRVFVAYSQLLVDWRTLLQSVSLDLGFDWRESIAAAEEELEHFIDGSLQHNSAIEAPSDPYIDLARLAHTALLEGPAKFKALQPRLQANLDEVVNANQNCILQINESLLAIERDGHEINALKFTKMVLESEIERIKGTASWRITKPLRLVANLLRRSS